MAGILGGGPGFSGRGSRVTMRQKTGALSARQRQIKAAMNGGFKAEFVRIAKELQAVVVDEVEEGLVRPAASSGKLAKTTASARNRDAGNDFFIVGIPSYLRYSGKGRKGQKANYALAVEEGTRALLGRRLTGVWIMGGKFLPFGQRKPGHMFRATRASTARKLLDQAGPVSGIIEKPILPHNDYRQAWDKYKPREKILAAVNRKLGGLNKKR